MLKIRQLIIFGHLNLSNILDMVNHIFRKNKVLLFYSLLEIVPKKSYKFVLKALT